MVIASASLSHWPLAKGTPQHGTGDLVANQCCFMRSVWSSQHSPCRRMRWSLSIRLLRQEDTMGIPFLFCLLNFSRGARETTNSAMPIPSFAKTGSRLRAIPIDFPSRLTMAAPAKNPLDNWWTSGDLFLAVSNEVPRYSAAGVPTTHWQLRWSSESRRPSNNARSLFFSAGTRQLSLCFGDSVLLLVLLRRIRPRKAMHCSRSSINR